MKSVVLILFVVLALVVAVSGFGVTFWLVSKHAGPVATHTEDSSLPIVKASDPRAALPPGNNPWWDKWSEGNGPRRLVNKFRGAEYTPRENGKIEITRPEAWFYMPNGQQIRLVGTDGEVEIPESTSSKSRMQFSGGGPQRGRIHNVIIELYNMYPDSNPAIPDETMTTDNIHFDNNTMLISTEGVTIDNKEITGDQVPVHMRATPPRPGFPPRGYDLEGRGLKLRWNDKDGRLDLLEIAHGESLTVHDTSTTSGMFGGPKQTDKSPTTLPAPAVALSVAAPATPESAGASAPGTATPAITAAAPIVAEPARPAPAVTAPAQGTGSAHKDPPPIPVPYLATFSDNVRITQGKEVLITADVMDVDFISRQDQQTPATKPSPVGSTAKPPTNVSSLSQPPASVARDAPPASGTTNHPINPVVVSTQPVTHARAATTKPAATVQSAPTVIYWTGKLHMAPAKSDRPKVTAGDAIVALSTEPFHTFGFQFPPVPNPVTVYRQLGTGQEGDFICAARVVYHTADGGVSLSHSANVPQVLITKVVNGKIDPKSTITTDKLDYPKDDAGRKYAQLSGAGHALAPMESTGGKPGDASKAGESIMDARWKQGARVYFQGKGQDQMAIEHVDLTGDVDVQHPQLVMQSQALSLFFEPPAPQAVRPARAPATRPANANGKPQQELKTVVAKEAVHCEMTGQNGKKQIIDCKQLVMRTARSDEGKFYTRTVDTEGNVHARDGDDEIWADFIDLTLRPARPPEKLPGAAAADHGAPRSAIASATPATRPAKEDSDTTAVELETMHARDHVRVANKDGSSARGAGLTITTEGGQQHVRLTGSTVTKVTDADRNAIVIDAKKNIIAGPVITLEPKDGVAHVVGPGIMHVLQEQAGESNPRPMDVRWTDHADMDGPKDRVDVIGAVAIQTHDADGTVNDVTGDRVHIDLIKKLAPATRPATQPVGHATAIASTQPSTRPAKKGTPADSMQMDIMKDKDVRTITIDGNAQVISTLSAANGTVARQLALVAPKIIYELMDAKQQPVKTLIVPSAGRMLVSDHRPPEAKKGDKAGAEGDESSSRGDTAFKWARRLTYTEQDREAIMNGDVYVKHRPDGKDASEIEVRHADQVTASFEQQKPTTRPATTRPATGPATNVAVAPTTNVVLAPATKPATRPARAPETGTAMQLKHLVADGHVEINRSGATLLANQVDYDPITHWMIARGSENRPVEYIDPDPKKSMTAGQMEWNTQTWNIKLSEPKISHPK